MKKLTLSLLCLSFIALTTHAQIVNIPDANFKAALIAYPNYVDLNGDGDIQLSEAQAKTIIDVSSKSITDLTGIAAFTSLTSLSCNNNQLTTLDVSKDTALTLLVCRYNQLTTLYVSKDTALNSIDCSNNQLATLDVSKNTVLTILDFSSNNLTAIDVSKNTALTQLYCTSNQLTALDIRKDTALMYLDCFNNTLTALDISKNTALIDLRCFSNQLTALDVSKNTTLTSLECYLNPNLLVVCVNNTQLGLTTSNPSGWQKDAATSWSTSCASSIDESYNVTIAPKLVHAYNLMGQKIIPEQVKEGIYIYHYSDGSVRKIGKFENVK